MDEAWKLLMEAGLPVGALRPPGRGPLSALAIGAALREITAAAGELGPEDRDALAAWASGFRHHWPSRFSALVASETAALLAGIEPEDPNRYLKLRRIAIENLSGRL